MYILCFILFKESIPFDRVTYREIKTDVGNYLKNDSIQPDTERLLTEIIRLLNWESQVREEQEFLRQNRVDLILSDISPLPFEAANC